MREYGQVQTAFWSNPEIQELDDDGKLLALYLLTGPHSNGIGCFRLPDGYVMADLGWDKERVHEGFRKLFEIGFSERCESTDFVLIPKFLHWNAITNPNIASAREKEIGGVPKKSSVYNKMLCSMKDYGKHWSKQFETLLQTLPKQDPTRPDPKGTDPDQTPPAAGARANTPPPDPDKPDNLKPRDAHHATDDLTPPPGIPEDSWHTFVAYRADMGRPLNKHAAKTIWKNLLAIDEDCRAPALDAAMSRDLREPCYDAKPAGNGREPTRRKTALQRAEEDYRRAYPNESGTTAADDPPLPGKNARPLPGQGTGGR